MVVSDSYFKPVALYSVVITALLYYGLASTGWNPDWVPEEYFGPIARAVRSANKSHGGYARQGLIALPLVHSLEGLIAFMRCQKLGIRGTTTLLWVLQTFLFGIGSLKFLLWPLDDSVKSKKRR